MPCALHRWWDEGGTAGRSVGIWCQGWSHWLAQIPQWHHRYWRVQCSLSVIQWRPGHLVSQVIIPIAEQINESFRPSLHQHHNSDEDEMRFADARDNDLLNGLVWWDDMDFLSLWSGSKQCFSTQTEWVIILPASTNTVESTLQQPPEVFQLILEYYVRSQPEGSRYLRYLPSRL